MIDTSPLKQQDLLLAIPEYLSLIDLVLSTFNLCIDFNFNMIVIIILMAYLPNLPVIQ